VGRVVSRAAVLALCAAFFFCLIPARTLSQLAPVQNGGNLNCAWCPMAPTTPTDALINSTVNALCQDADQNFARMNETQNLTARGKYVQYLSGCGDAHAGLNQARIYACAVEVIRDTIPFLSQDAEAGIWRERAASLISKALPEAKADSDLVKLLLQLRDRLLQPHTLRPS
jgi:hypothetical protein